MKMQLSDGLKFNLYVSHDRETDKPLWKFPFKVEKGLVFDKSLARGTHVSIYTESNQLVATGESYCCPPDQFVKHRGLARAMKRCLSDAGLNKAQRTEVYKKLFGGK